MRTLLIKNAQLVATFDNADPAKARELKNTSIFIRGNLIEAIGPADQLPKHANEVIDAAGHLVMPGMVNTHHHMFQSLTRAIPNLGGADA
jgi:cytosine/adenosine deaminase-related metal-dependent hydrolase